LKGLKKEFGLAKMNFVTALILVLMREIRGPVVLSNPDGIMLSERNNMPL
jgi:hypothetical protein